MELERISFGELGQVGVGMNRFCCAKIGWVQRKQVLVCQDRLGKIGVDMLGQDWAALERIGFDVLGQDWTGENSLQCVRRYVDWKEQVEIGENRLYCVKRDFLEKTGLNFCLNLCQERLGLEKIGFEVLRFVEFEKDRFLFVRIGYRIGENML